jgi:hypothetical protein
VGENTFLLYVKRICLCLYRERGRKPKDVGIYLVAPGKVALLGYFK